LIDADHVAVLAAMATYIDGEGRCTLSQSKIAELLKRSRPWVNRVIGELSKTGILERTHRTGENNAPLANAYRLQLTPPGDAPCQVDDTPCHVEDTPCHVGDTKQTLNNKNTLSPTPGHARGNVIKIIPDESWRPSTAAIASARRARPDADIETIEMSITHFIAKSIANGYQYDEEKTSYAWLTWFLEDGFRWSAHSKRTASQAARANRAPDDRLVAWGVAAHSAPRH